MRSDCAVILAGPLDPAIERALGAVRGVEVVRLATSRGVREAIEGRRAVAVVASLAWPESTDAFAAAHEARPPLSAVGVEGPGSRATGAALEAVVDSGQPEELTAAIDVARRLDAERRARERALADATAANRSLARVVERQRAIAGALSSALDREQSTLGGAPTSTVAPLAATRFVQVADAARFLSAIVHECRRGRAGGVAFALLRIASSGAPIVDLLRPWDLLLVRGGVALALMPEIDRGLFDAVAARVPPGERATFGREADALAWARERLSAL